MSSSSLRRWEAATTWGGGKGGEQGGGGVGERGQKALPATPGRGEQSPFLVTALSLLPSPPLPAAHSVRTSHAPSREHPLAARHRRRTPSRQCKTSRPDAAHHWAGQLTGCCCCCSPRPLPHCCCCPRFLPRSHCFPQPRPLLRLSRRLLRSHLPRCFPRKLRARRRLQALPAAVAA